MTLRWRSSFSKSLLADLGRFFTHTMLTNFESQGLSKKFLVSRCRTMSQTNLPSSLFSLTKAKSSLNKRKQLSFFLHEILLNLDPASFFTFLLSKLSTQSNMTLNDEISVSLLKYPIWALALILKKRLSLLQIFS